MSTEAEQSNLTGQMVIPGFESILGFEIIVLPAQQEQFCQRYVLQGGINAKKAYKLAYPDVSDKAAESGASRLLRNDKVRARILQLAAEARRRVAATVINYHLDVMEVDRRTYLDANGNVKPFDQLDERAAAILEFEQVSTKNGVRTLVKVPTRHQSSVELAKIGGMQKECVELNANLNHSGAVGVTDDAAKLDSLRGRFKAVTHGAAGTPS